MRSVVLSALLIGVLIAYALFAPRAQTIELLGRLGPIMLFLATISIVINLAAAAGLFHRVAGFAARGRAASGPGLWILVVLLAVVSTTFLSLDTTAVLVTPLVLALAARAGNDPVPLALTVVWIANTGSLLLPVSNLTNLLAVETGLFDGTSHYVRLAAMPAAASLAVTAGFAWVVFRRRLRTPRRAPDETRGASGSGPPHPLLPLTGIVVSALLPLLTTSIPFWWSTSTAAIILVVAFALADRSVLRPNLIPWTALALAVGLTVAVQLVHSLGVEDLVRGAYAHLDGSASAPFVLAAAGAVLSNAVNNIPAYLLLEPAAGSSPDLIALLIGSNFGPIVTPWASLATLLWADQLRRAGLAVPWKQFVVLGIPLAVSTVAVSEPPSPSPRADPPIGTRRRSESGNHLEVQAARLSHIDLLPRLIPVESNDPPRTVELQPVNLGVTAIRVQASCPTRKMTQCVDPLVTGLRHVVESRRLMTVGVHVVADEPQRGLRMQGAEVRRRREQVLRRLGASGEKHVLFHEWTEPEYAVMEVAGGEVPVEIHGVLPDEQCQHCVTSALRSSRGQLGVVCPAHRHERRTDDVQAERSSELLDQLMRT